jgi:hypothetical protein
LVAHGDYSSIANCRAKIPAIFRGIFGIFRGISKFVFIYSTISRGTLVGKHWHRDSLHIRMSYKQAVRQADIYYVRTYADNIVVCTYCSDYVTPDEIRRNSTIWRNLKLPDLPE